MQELLKGFEGRDGIKKLLLMHLSASKSGGYSRLQEISLKYKGLGSPPGQMSFPCSFQSKFLQFVRHAVGITESGVDFFYFS